MAKKKRKTPSSTPAAITQPQPEISKTISGKTSSGRNSTIDSAMMMTLLFVVGLVPWLVRAKAIDFTAPRIINPAIDTGLQIGLFAYYKWLALMIAAGFLLAAFIYKIAADKYELKPSYINVPILMLVLLAVGSLMAADYKYIALIGMYNQRDGTLLLLAYLALFLTATNVLYRPWFFRGITFALLVFTVVNAVLMLADFSGHDLLRSSFIQFVLAPPALRGSLSGDIGNVMGNSNYISGFAAALFAYFGAGTLLHKHAKEQVVNGLGALANFAMVLISFSSSGFFTLVIMLPLFLLVLWRSNDRLRSVVGAGSLLAGCMLIFWLLNSSNPYIYHETVGLFWPQASNTQEIMSPTAKAVASPAKEFQLPKPGWSPGTGRTYNWAETLKLTRARPWLGYGYGTLTYYFPQDDINKVANLRSYDRLITKPHSMYVGIAFGLGIPALLILLVLFFLHFYHTGRQLWRTPLDSGGIFPLALFLFFCAFAVQALFNDPVVDSGAIFWILLGVSASLNVERDQPSPTTYI